MEWLLIHKSCIHTVLPSVTLSKYQRGWNLFIPTKNVHLYFILLAIHLDPIHKIVI